VHSSQPSRSESRTGSRDSGTGYGLDDQGGWISTPSRVKNFLFCMSCRPALRLTQPPIQWVPGVKRPGCEADHSPPTSISSAQGQLYVFPEALTTWCPTTE
jgi:hypothetical protein